MPDGDVVYHVIGRQFGGAYNALCESFYTHEQVAAKISKALRKMLKHYGNPPIQLVMRTVTEVSDALMNGLSIDVEQEGYLIDQLARELMGHRRATPLAVDACKWCVIEAIHGNSDAISEVVVVREYINRVIDADFFEHLPLLNHHNDISPEAIEKRLRQVRPYLDREIEHMVAQIVRLGCVDSLKKRRQKRVAKLDFSEMDIAMPEDWQGSAE
ncbi:MAG: hypothetical protein H6673_10125 [Anaerolineales bacterium]|nr:hypothetical protein [Anaerolineales bacterium]